MTDPGSEDEALTGERADHVVPPLTASRVLLDGWNARYARTIFVVNEGHYGGALVDGNGDGAELDLGAFTWTPTDGWRWPFSTGAGPRKEPGREPVLHTSLGRSPMLATGAAPAGATVHLGFGDDIRTVTANGDGLWLAIYVPPGEWPYTEPFVVDWEPGPPIG